MLLLTPSLDYLKIDLICLRRPDAELSLSIREQGGSKLGLSIGVLLPIQLRIRWLGLEFVELGVG